MFSEPLRVVVKRRFDSWALEPHGTVEVMDEAEQKELAKQLRNPDGQKGLDTAKFMNETNTQMITSTIDRLDLHTNHRVLELGYGNGDHVSYMLDQADDLTYMGLDISATMNAEAQRRNVAACESGQASFELYDGEEIPFEESSFDRIFTVNTIYFWADTRGLLNELYRVLNPSGLLAVAFVQKESMKALPFTAYGFEIFDHQRIKDTVAQSDFGTVEFTNMSDTVTSQSGESFERHYSIASMTK